MREVETLDALLKEPWEKAEKLESLAARLKVLDEELVKAGIDLKQDKTDTQDENAVEEIVVEDGRAGTADWSSTSRRSCSASMRSTPR